MEMKHVRCIGFMIAMLLIFNSVSSAQEKLKPNFKVSLIIFGDKDIEQDTESYLSRELRSLGDVTVVTPNVDLVEDCSLWCTIKKVITRSGKPSGLTFSVVYCERQAVEDLYKVQDGILDLVEEIKTMPKSGQSTGLSIDSSLLFLEMDKALSTIGKYSMQYSQLYIGGPDSLRTLCETAITHFDNHYLKKKREARAK